MATFLNPRAIYRRLNNGGRAQLPEERDELCEKTEEGCIAARDGADPACEDVCRLAALDTKGRLSCAAIYRAMNRGVPGLRRS